MSSSCRKRVDVASNIIAERIETALARTLPAGNSFYCEFFGIDGVVSWSPANRI